MLQSSHFSIYILRECNNRDLPNLCVNVTECHSRSDNYTLARNMKQTEFLVAPGQTLGVWGEWPLIGCGVCKVNEVNELQFNQEHGNNIYTNNLPMV